MSFDARLAALPDHSLAMFHAKATLVDNDAARWVDTEVFDRERARRRGEPTPPDSALTLTTAQAGSIALWAQHCAAELSDFARDANDPGALGLAVVLLALAALIVARTSPDASPSPEPTPTTRDAPASAGSSHPAGRSTSIVKTKPNRPGLSPADRALDLQIEQHRQRRTAMLNLAVRPEPADIRARSRWAQARALARATAQIVVTGGL